MEHRRSPIVRRRPARAVLRWPEPAADPRQARSVIRCAAVDALKTSAGVWYKRRSLALFYIRRFSV